ncbi:MAG: YdeI/OmpD-associated family protein [Chloroflexi bacterium]|nr:YdeI/OmpD-associated family protein [Chloroflexota bacterium]
MKTKLGQTIPDDLSGALQKDPVMPGMWDKLRPSCQRTYIEYLVEAKKPETRTRRVERILKMTADCYQRHQKKT